LKRKSNKDQSLQTVANLKNLRQNTHNT